MGDKKYEYKVDPRLPLVQDADLQDKIVLLRVVRALHQFHKLLGYALFGSDLTLDSCFNWFQ